MKILDLQQGSPEWLKAREGAFTASVAPAMMNDGYNSRDIELEYAVGVRDRDTTHLEKLFEEGHAAEAAARPIFEEEYGVVVAPIVGVKEVDGMTLLASFDGITIDNDLVWEHKFTGKKFDDIPPLYYWQIEHQLLVAGAEKAVLTVTSRTDGSIRHYEYKSIPERRKQLIEGWKKWKKDIESYERTDDEWCKLADEYVRIKTEIEELSKKQKEVSEKLHKLAGGRTAFGNGVKVSVTEQWEQKMTPAAYIKEHGIDLPVKKLDKPKLNYRITIREEQK